MGSLQDNTPTLHATIHNQENKAWGVLPYTGYRYVQHQRVFLMVLFIFKKIKLHKKFVHANTNCTHVFELFFNFLASKNTCIFVIASLISLNIKLILPSISSPTVKGERVGAAINSLGFFSHQLYCTCLPIMAAAHRFLCPSHSNLSAHV